MTRTILLRTPARSTTTTRSVCRASGFVQVLGLYRKRSGEMLFGATRNPNAGAFSIERLEVSRFLVVRSYAF